MIRYLFIFLSFALYAETPKVVEVVSVKRGDIQNTTTLIGTVKAKKSVLLLANSSGILTNTIPSGDSLKKGDIIANLNNKDETKSLNLVEQAEKIAKDQYDRTIILAKVNAVNKKELEESKNQWLTAQKALLSAKADLEKTQFIAPFDGIVGNYKARNGSQVQSGEQVVSFYDPSTLIVEFDIPAHAISKLKASHPVFVEGKKYILNSVSKMVDPETYMVPAYCDIACTNCFVGEAIEVMFPIEFGTNVLLLSADAVFLKDGNTVVYKVFEGKVHLTEVKTGLREKNLIEIKEGLDEGDSVVVTGQSRLYDDTEVTVAKTAP